MSNEPEENATSDGGTPRTSNRIQDRVSEASGPVETPLALSQPKVKNDADDEEEKVEMEPVMYVKYRAYQLPREEHVQISTTLSDALARLEGDLDNVKKLSVLQKQNSGQEDCESGERLLETDVRRKGMLRHSKPSYFSSRSHYESSLSSCSSGLEDWENQELKTGYIEDMRPSKVVPRPREKKPDANNVKKQDGVFCSSYKCLVLTSWGVILILSSAATFLFMDNDKDTLPEMTLPPLDVDDGVPWEVWIPLFLALLGLLFFAAIFCIWVSEKRSPKQECKGYKAKDNKKAVQKV